MEPSRRSLRTQAASPKKNWSLSLVSVLLAVIAVLMCYLIVLSVSQSLKLTSIQSKLATISQQASEGESLPETQGTAASQPLTSSAPNSSPGQPPQEEAEQQSPASASGVYIVESGDSLSSIADQLGTTVDALMSQNELSSHMLQVGQELVH